MALEQVIVYVVVVNFSSEIEKLRLYGPIYYWSFLEQLDKLLTASTPFMNKIRALQFVKSPVGKGRAWIRASLNSNLLEQYLTVLTRNNDLCRYAPSTGS